MFYKNLISMQLNSTVHQKKVKNMQMNHPMFRANFAYMTFVNN